MSRGTSVKRHTLRHRFPCAMALLICMVGAEAGNDDAQRFLQVKAAIAAALPGGDIVIKGHAEGDLNGDGLPDFAAVVEKRSSEGPGEERLVVMTGTADGGHTLLSMSGEYCGAGKFYELSINRAALHVKGVWTAEPERWSMVTLQFRHNQRMNDLQLIGEESNSRDDGQTYRESINFLTGVVAHTREAGKKRKEIRARLLNATDLPLQGFACFVQDGMKPNVYIDPTFRVRRP